MDHYKKLQNQITLRLFWMSLWCSVCAVGAAATLWFGFEAQPVVAIACGLLVSIIMSVCVAYLTTPVVLRPIHALWQAILHVSPSSQDVTPPNLDSLQIGRELVTSLALQVYQMAQTKPDNLPTSAQSVHKTQPVDVISRMPLPVFVISKARKATSASTAALDYCRLDKEAFFDKPLFDSLHLEFTDDKTLEAWMDECQQNKISDRHYWERVRLRPAGIQEPMLCDLAAYFDRDNPSGTEFIITLFDRTQRYEEEDKAMNFVAMAVHELRTPLTIMRGYIEVFQEELTDQLDDELKDFMRKLQVSAEQLTSFVNNILNVARIENDQLELTLAEENWGELLTHIVEDNNLRAKVHEKQITLVIEPSLPTAGVDKVSIYEVMSNLLDNAIKYSAQSKEIVVTTKLGKEGMIETTVKDSGVGIPSSVLPNLFEKFYRNHRTRSSIGGTGLGLYLSKAIISAHGGQIWAESHEGQGSTFGFTLQPYSQTSKEVLDKDKDVTRSAHGWVKNHTLYRR